MTRLIVEGVAQYVYVADSPYRLHCSVNIRDRQKTFSSSFGVHGNPSLYKWRPDGGPAVCIERAVPTFLPLFFSDDTGSLKRFLTEKLDLSSDVTAEKVKGLAQEYFGGWGAIEDFKFVSQKSPAVDRLVVQGGTTQQYRADEEGLYEFHGGVRISDKLGSFAASFSVEMVNSSSPHMSSNSSDSLKSFIGEKLDLSEGVTKEKLMRVVEEYFGKWGQGRVSEFSFNENPILISRTVED